jgi:predicted Zn-dependent protease
VPQPGNMVSLEDSIITLYGINEPVAAAFAAQGSFVLISSGVIE